VLTTTVPIQSADDLRARIRELAADEPHPAVITDRILRGLTLDECRVVATVTLHEYVRHVVRQPNPAAADAHRTYKTAAGAATPSRKIAAIRDWVARELGRSVCLDESAQEWKHMGECTAADLLKAAAILHQKAALTAAKAEQMEDVAKAVEHAGVPTVRDLPRETLEAVLRR
jgi:hypothetical protein